MRKSVDVDNDAAMLIKELVREIAFPPFEPLFSL
jgi:hypothetical protein